MWYGTVVKKRNYNGQIFKSKRDFVYTVKSDLNGEIQVFTVLADDPGRPKLYPYTEETLQMVKDEMAATDRMLEKENSDELFRQLEKHRFGTDTYYEFQLLQESCKRQC